MTTTNRTLHGRRSSNPDFHEHERGRVRPSTPIPRHRSTYGFTLPRNFPLAPVPERPLPELSRTISRYPHVLKRPFDNPHEVLCNVFGIDVESTQMDSVDSIPLEYAVPASRDVPVPTHMLAVLPQHPTPYPHNNVYPNLIPLRTNLIPHSFWAALVGSSGRRVSQSKTQSKRQPLRYEEVTQVPVVTVKVPHPPSIPLLFLFVLGDQGDSGRTGGAGHTYASYVPSCSYAHSRSHESAPAALTQNGASENTKSMVVPARERTYTNPPGCLGLLSTYLLPLEALEEFPAQAEMAYAMEQACDAEQLEDYTRFNHGLWANLLNLGCKEPAILDLVETAWYVTKIARRIRNSRIANI